MFHRTSPSMLRRPSALLAGAALLGTCALSALPAQAGTVGDAESPILSYLVPANSTVTVTMTRLQESPDDAPSSPTFPAGNYWYSVVSLLDVLPIYVEDLSEQFGAWNESWHSVTLTEPGPIVIDQQTGSLGTYTFITLSKVPADAPDPSTMTEEEISDYLESLGLEWGITDEVYMTAASIDAPAADAALEVFVGDGEEMPTEWMTGDFHDIGVNTIVVREGNVISVLGPNAAVDTFTFGRATDTMLVGDWDGDGRDTLGMRRGNLLFLDDDLDGGWAEHTYTFGRAGDEVLVGDWDGDGKDTVAVRRGNTFYVTNDFKGGNAPISFAFGRATDQAFAGDWDQDGKDSIAVQREDGFTFVKNTLAGGAADAMYPIPKG